MDTMFVVVMNEKINWQRMVGVLDNTVFLYLENNNRNLVVNRTIGVIYRSDT